MNLRDSITQVLSDKKAKREGLHVKHIARHIYNANILLFPDNAELDYEKIKNRVNQIILYDIKKSRKRTFRRVVNPKTNKYRKGWYKLKWCL